VLAGFARKGGSPAGLALERYLGDGDPEVRARLATQARAMRGIDATTRQRILGPLAAFDPGDCALPTDEVAIKRVLQSHQPPDVLGAGAPGRTVRAPNCEGVTYDPAVMSTPEGAAAAARRVPNVDIRRTRRGLAEGEPPPQRTCYAPHMRAPDPTSTFTDMQWYMYHQRNVALFAAFARAPLAPADLLAVARRLTVLAPQLRLGYLGADPSRPIADDTLRRLIVTERVNSLDTFPEARIDDGRIVLSDPDLPLFRIRYSERADGPDALGRSGFILVQASHALVEGADSALLSRSQSAAHPEATAPRPSPPLVRFAATGLGAVLSSLHLVAGNLMSPHPGPFVYAARSSPRATFPRLARALGVRQRALFYALVMHALFDLGGASRRRNITSTYSVIDEGGGADRDRFMRMRMLFARFAATSDFAAFARATDDRLTQSEARESGFNAELNAAGIRIHRGLSKLIPFAYTPKLFTFMPYDIVLGLIPPHRLGGDLTENLLEPVYAGAALEGANACVIVPGRTQVSFNFHIEQKMLPGVDRLNPLLA